MSLFSWLLRRRPLLSAAGGAAIAYSGYKVAFDQDFDIHNVGAARFGRAAVAVGRIGTDYWRTLYTKAAEQMPAEELEASKCACHQRSADTLLKMACDNGGVFIKVGQHIGALDYLLPEEYVQTLKVLHHRAPEMDLEDVFKVIRDDLKQEPSEIFETFDEKPLGTASLAQVHRATLKSNGKEVAVKVQHLKVKQHSYVDIHTMDFLVRAVKFVFPQFEFMWLADLSKKNLPMELDFKHEGENSEMVAMLLQHHTWLKVPEVHWDLSTDRVLTMEYCHGGHVNDLDYIRSQGIDPHFVSEKIGQMYADMIFHYGYVHCDPHPGNVLVQKDEAGNPQIVLLDHGLYTQLTNTFRMNYANFWLSILNSDEEGLKKYATALDVGPLYRIFGCMVSGRSWNSIVGGIATTEKDASESKHIKENAQRYIREIVSVLCTVNRQMILLFKTNDLLRAIEHSLGTQSSMASFVQMSRACFRCLAVDRKRKAKTRLETARASLSAQWDQFKISVYQVYLWLWHSRLGRVLKRIKFTPTSPAASAS